VFLLLYYYFFVPNSNFTKQKGTYINIYYLYYHTLSLFFQEHLKYHILVFQVFLTLNFYRFFLFLLYINDKLFLYNNNWQFHLWNKNTLHRSIYDWLREMPVSWSIIHDRIFVFADRYVSTNMFKLLTRRSTVLLLSILSNTGIHKYCLYYSKFKSLKIVNIKYKI